MNEQDLIARCLHTRRRTKDRPSGAWSTGERLAVALVLKNKTVLDEMGYTVQEAAQRLFGEPWTPSRPEEFVAWLNAIRDRVDAERMPGDMTAATSDGTNPKTSRAYRRVTPPSTYLAQACHVHLDEPEDGCLDCHPEANR